MDRVPLHPDFHFFATQNSAALAGRNQLPEYILMRSILVDVPAYEHWQASL